MYIRRSVYVLCLRGALGSISTQFSDFAKGFLSAYLGLSAFREATLIPCFFCIRYELPFNLRRIEPILKS